MRNWFRANGSKIGVAGVLLGVLLLVVVTILSVTPVTAASPGLAAPPPQGDPPTDESCLACHQQPGMTGQVGGEPLSVTVDPEKFAASVHAEEDVNCVDCHTNITGFPHPEVTASSRRDFVLELYPTCQECHQEQYDQQIDSVHQRAIAAGNHNAAVCSDCHNPHTQTRLTDPATDQITQEARVMVPQTCAQCHSTIYETYRQSVHGVALQDGNTDVPTCTDCHGVHDIPDPSSNTFRNSIPSLCARCHTDETMMAKYDLHTNVLDTYVTDFHGTTVHMFEENFPDQPTNKPVCTDCHGFHEIQRVDDPEAGIAFKRNLLVKCQECHPDATTESFTDSWMSHYQPSPTVFPLVFFVNLFYKIFIPAVLGGMILFVLSDVYRRFIVRRTQAKGATHE